MSDFDKNNDNKLTIKGLIGIKKTGSSNTKYKRGDGPPNPEYKEKFINYGNLDYEAAKILFNVENRGIDDDFLNLAAFLCAQSTELYLKAFLFCNALRHYPGLTGKEVLNKFRNLSHNLEKILEECVKDNQDFGNFRDEIKNINKYSELKYPDVEDELVYSYEGLTIGSDMLKDVKEIGDFIKKIINN